MKYRHWVLLGLEVFLLLLNLQAAPFLFVDFVVMDLLLGKHVLDQGDNDGASYAFWILVCFSVFTAGRFRTISGHWPLLQMMLSNALMMVLGWTLFNLSQLVQCMDEKGGLHRYVIPVLIWITAVSGLFVWKGWIPVNLFSFRVYFRSTHLIQVLLVLMCIRKPEDVRDFRSLYISFAGSLAAGLLLLDMTQVIVTVGMFVLYCRKNHNPVLWKGMLGGGAASALMVYLKWNEVSRMAVEKLQRIYGQGNIVSDLFGNVKLFGSSGTFAVEFDGLIGQVNRYGLWVLAIVIFLCIMLCVSCLHKRGKVAEYVGMIIGVNCFLSVIGLIFPVQLSTCYIPFEYSVQLMVMLLLLMPFMDSVEEEASDSDIEVLGDFNIVA